MQITTDAIVLRCWPVNEADLIVSLLTREYGKLKGVAKAGLKSRKRFGGALEMMSEVRVTFFERPRQELVRLDHFDLIQSPLGQPVDYARMTTLSFFAEVVEEALPDRSPEELAYRLLAAVLEYDSGQQMWLAITYFSLWMTRLMGWLPDLGTCALCQQPLLQTDAQRDVWFDAVSDGLYCAAHRKPVSMALSHHSLHLAQKIVRTPLAELARLPWNMQFAADLRRFAFQSLERHLERRLRTAEVLRRMASQRAVSV